jgi:hypothetical protein
MGIQPNVLFHVSEMLLIHFHPNKRLPSPKSKGHVLKPVTSLEEDGSRCFSTTLSASVFFLLK